MPLRPPSTPPADTDLRPSREWKGYNVPVGRTVMDRVGKESWGPRAGTPLAQGDEFGGNSTSIEGVEVVRALLEID